MGDRQLNSLIYPQLSLINWVISYNLGSHLNHNVVIYVCFDRHSYVRHLVERVFFGQNGFGAFASPFSDRLSHAFGGSGSLGLFSDPEPILFQNHIQTIFIPFPPSAV